MSTLLLRLAAPMQSWGVTSRFSRRTTEPAPSKSGVIGLLAAACGLRRTDPLEDLLTLKFGVRIDQQGRIERDFQTARPDKGKALPLTNRYYLTDAVFVAGVEGPEELINGLHEAIRLPQFPLFLGRRSCPPSRPIDMGVYQKSVWELLRDPSDNSEAPWQAAEWYQKKQDPTVKLELRFDENAVPLELRKSRESDDRFIRLTERDEPISFNPELRQYGTRTVIQTYTDPFPNSKSRWRAKEAATLSHDPMAALLGGA